MNEVTLFSVIILVSLWFIVSIFAYVSLSLDIGVEGGRIETRQISFPDLLVLIILGGFFASTAIIQLIGPARTLNSESITLIQAQSPWIVIVASIAAFIKARDIKLVPMFGVELNRIPRSLSTAAVLILLAFPLIGAANLLTAGLPERLLDEQQLVSVFKEVVRQKRFQAMAEICISGVIIAPPVEEFLFRGYFYRILKKYLGGFGGAIVGSLLFALVHANLASMLGLFTLAICLTIAYEATGSLYVPVGMHALFNAGNLIFLYLKQGSS